MCIKGWLNLYKGSVWSLPSSFGHFFGDLIAKKRLLESYSVCCFGPEHVPRRKPFVAPGILTSWSNRTQSRLPCGTQPNLIQPLGIIGFLFWTNGHFGHSFFQSPGIWYRNSFVRKSADRCNTAIQGSPLSRGATGEHGRAKDRGQIQWHVVCLYVCLICHVLMCFTGLTIYCSVGSLEVLRCFGVFHTAANPCHWAAFCWALLLCWPRQHFPAYSWVLTWAPMIKVWEEEQPYKFDLL